MDAWTSPNHRAFVAVAVHLQYKGVPISFPLDIVEVPKSHTGQALAEALATVFADFGIEDKVRLSIMITQSPYAQCLEYRFWPLRVIAQLPMIQLHSFSSHSAHISAARAPEYAALLMSSISSPNPS